MDIEKMVDKLDEVTRRLAPEFPIGYEDMYFMTGQYMAECFLNDEEYDEDKLLDKLRMHALKGY